MLYTFMRGLARLIARVYLVGLLSVRGRDSVPRRGALLVCGNHSSNADPPLVPAFLPRRDSWSMAKAEYFAGQGFKPWIFRSYHSFPVVRHTADRAAIRRALAVLGAGQALVVYPEGTRVEDGRLRRPEPGAGFLALHSGAPIQPVAAIGTARCFPKGSFWPRRARVELVYGPPFKIVERWPDGHRVAFQEASDAIMLRIAELLPEEVRGEFSDLEAERRRLGPITRPLQDAPPAEGAAG